MNPIYTLFRGRPDLGLTARERAIVALVSAGYSNRDLAQALEISENTAREHLAKLLEKLGVSNTIELVLFAVHEGLVEEN